MRLTAGSWTARVLGALAILVLAVLLVLTVRVLLVPFVAAMFVVYLFEPGIELLQRRGMERGKAYVLILALTTALIGILLTLAPSWLRIEALSTSTETFQDRLYNQLLSFEGWLKTRLPMFENVEIADQATRHANAVAQNFLIEFPSLITSFLLNLILVPFIAYFMVRDGRALKRKIVALVPNRYFEMSLLMFHRIDEQIGGYLRGRLIECMLVGVTQMLLMGLASAVVAGQHQILLISAVCGVTNLIPYAGPVLGAAFGVFLYFAADLPLFSIWTLLGVIVLTQLADNILIAPAVLSNNVDLHPLTVALVLVIGGEILGILGLLIAIPVASSIKVVAQEFYANYQAQAP